MEIWKDIKGYEGLYQVSNLGRVKSLARKVIKAYGAEHNLGERIKKINTNHSGYPIVRLHNGRGKTFQVHKLVAKAFLGESNGLEVNHIDGDKSNNNINNLEYCTRGENIKHAYKLGLKKANPQRGGSNPNARIVLNVRTGIYYTSIVEAAKAIGVSKSRLYNIFFGNVKNKTDYVLV